MDINNKKCFLFFLIIIGNICFCYAQYPLLKEYVCIRANDTIIKQEVAYINPGRSGSDVFWNFSKLQNSKVPYRVCYKGDDRFVSGMEHQTVYNYILNTGDSLFLAAYRNRTTSFKAILPGLEFRYPFQYLDSIKNVFYGEGKYSDKLAFVSQGKSEVIADAWGTMLLPDNDTLKNVMRICFRKEIYKQVSNSDSILLRIHADSAVLNRERILSHLQNDTVVLRVRRYRWYAEGYRYPVFETVQCETIRSGVPIAYYTTAFYYPPEEHSYLDRDTLNRQLQMNLKEQSLIVNNQNFPLKEDENKMSTELSVYYNFYPNPVEDGLKLEYYMSGKAPVSICLFNLSGCLLEQRAWNMQDFGVHIEVFPMSFYPKGNYLLRLIVANKTYVEKIIKE